MKKLKHNIPSRKYVKGDKKMVSMRLPSDLIQVLNKIAEAKGWPLTDLVVTVLDQFAQHENEEKPRK